MNHARSWDRSPLNAAIVAAIRERYPDGVLPYGVVLGMANELAVKWNRVRFIVLVLGLTIGPRPSVALADALVQRYPDRVLP